MAVIGIDLGTTNSAGAYCEGDQVVIVPSSRSDGLVPSVVAYRRTTDSYLVGDVAASFAARDPKNAIFSIKRLMGRSYDDREVEQVRSRVNYSMVRSPDPSDSGVKVLLNGKPHSPVDISAMILKQIKENAEKALNTKVTHAVITVPAYFEERQRVATRQAGEQAGLVVKRVIDEPSAAAIAWGVKFSKERRRRMLVFDLGGGTFDVSIIMTAPDPTGKNHFLVMKPYGNNWLGGDDFDRKIVDEIAERVRAEYGFDPSGDPAFQLESKQSAEKAKVELTQADKAEVLLPSWLKAPDGHFVDLQHVITREHFGELIQPFVDQCMDLVRHALHDQGLEADQIDTVLLVGGSTLVPLVHQTVSDFFGKDKVRGLDNPFYSVAKGAAILATAMQGIQCPVCLAINDEAAENCSKCHATLATAAAVGSSISVSDQTPMSFGIEAVRGEHTGGFEVIIPAGTLYPMTQPATRLFETTRDNYILVEVYEGTAPVISRNQWQGNIEVQPRDFEEEGLHAPAGTPLSISMNYNRNRELRVAIEIKGKILKETRLKHDRPRPAQTGLREEEQLVKELETAIRIGEHFQGSYDQYMENRDRERLKRDLERAHRALGQKAPREMDDARQTLVLRLDGCGTASLLFLADGMSIGAAPERARKISEFIQKIKDAWEHHDQQMLADQGVALRAAIAKEVQAQANRQAVPGQSDFRGIPRVR